MATSSYVGIDVSKDRLDVAVLGERQEKQADNTSQGITQLVEWMQELQPEEHRDCSGGTAASRRARFQALCVA